MNREPPLTGTGVSNERWFLCALVWAMVAATNSVAEPRPSHRGKPASYWLEQIDSSNVIGTKETIEAFKAMGSNAVPFLVETLRRKPSKLGEIVDEKLADYSVRHSVPEGLVKALPSAYRAEQRRENAAFLISQIGPDAARLKVDRSRRRFAKLCFPWERSSRASCRNSLGI